jgi:lipopolysaccharide/colanic/teichoic acid biosynthesis glycosyltransferase
MARPRFDADRGRSAAAAIAPADADRRSAALWAADQPRAIIAERPLKRLRLFVKRCTDVLVAAVALTILAPLLALIAITIQLDSPGPAIFRQTRIGRRGRRFEMWKFRTMVQGASDDLHRALVLSLVRGCTAADADRAAAPSRRSHKLANDPRITRVGRWLRKSSLDELPQLVNVLRGEMSLVGPRPPVTYEYEAYEPWQLERLAVPQGMTGLWQVSGRNRVSYRRMHDLDVEYVRTWSLWLDVKILVRTLRAVVVDAEPTA